MKGQIKLFETEEERLMYKYQVLLVLVWLITLASAARLSKEQKLLEWRDVAFMFRDAAFKASCGKINFLILTMIMLGSVRAKFHLKHQI